jgi:peptidoglycan hydrolase-like protein with peptidoglycan-binding domain
MKKYVFIIFTVLLSVCLFGCGKKDITPSETQEAMSMDSMNALNANLTMPAPEVVKPRGAQPVLITEPKTAAPAVQATTTPTVKEIQVALKNAGYYTGSIDGKLGPKTKKAIEEFQKANNLEADGKVGRKTWIILSKQLSVAVDVAR